MSCLASRNEKGGVPRLFRFGRRCALLVLSHAGLGLILPELGVGFEKIRRVDRSRSNIPPAANRSNAATCTNTVRKSESLSEAYRIHHSLVQKTPERLGCMGTMDACASKDFVPVRTREHVFRVGVNGLWQAYA